MRRLLATSIALGGLICSCLALAGCGHAGGPRASVSTSVKPLPTSTERLAFGLTEDNANLLWSPGDGAAPTSAGGFLPARRELTVLHPRYLRLLVDWAALQPSPGGAVDLAEPTSGCAREVAPCGEYAGIAQELEAIASQQRAARAEGRPGFEVVLDILGAPAWAASPPHGCEAPGIGPSARPLRPEAIAAYRSLIAALVALGRRENVALPWWSPWNEPNDPRFLSPQRASCDAGGAPLATSVYAQLATAMSAELGAVAPGDRMLLGELGGYDRGSPHRLSVGEFVAALPGELLCLGSVWAVHDYAARGRSGSEPDAVAVLESALSERGGCAASSKVWVTESGAGAREPGRPRREGPAEERLACLALAAKVLRWRADPRVTAVFQYEFRDDPAFPVGLASADLTHLTSGYRFWLSVKDADTGPSFVSTLADLCGGDTTHAGD